MNTSVVLSDNIKVISSPKNEKKVPTYLNKTMIELFGEEYLHEDYKIIFPSSNNTNINGNDWLSDDESKTENENPKIDSHLTGNEIGTGVEFINDDNTSTNGNDWLSDDESKTQNENLKIDSELIMDVEFNYDDEINTHDEKLNIEYGHTYDQILMQMKLKIRKIINLNGNIYANKIIKDLAVHFSNDEFSMELPFLVPNTIPQLIGELIVKLFEKFNNTEKNMKYLSGCLICVFRELVSKFPPSDIHKHFSLFIDCVKKFAKYYDERLWISWFVPRQFFDWCLTLAFVFIEDMELMVSFKDKTILQNAMKYYKKIKCCKYVFNNSKLRKCESMNGIFELTKKNNLDMDKLLSLSEKNVLKTYTNPITSKSEINKRKSGNYVETMSQTKKYKNIEEVCLIDLNTSQSMNGYLKLTERNNLLSMENVVSPHENPSITNINESTVEINSNKRKLNNDFDETERESKICKNIEEVCPVDLKTAHSENVNLEFLKTNNISDVEKLTSTCKNILISFFNKNNNEKENASKTEKDKISEEKSPVVSQPKITFRSEFSMSKTFNINQMNQLLCTNKEHSRVKKTRCSKKKNVKNVKKTRKNATNSQSRPTINSNNSISMNYQYSRVSDTQSSSAWNIRPSFSMENSQYPCVKTAEPKKKLQTELSNAMNSLNLAEMSTQYLDTTNTLPNQPVSNGWQNSILNNDKFYNMTNQHNAYNNFINTPNINDSQYYNHVTSSVPNTVFSNRDSTSLSQQPYQYNQQSNHSDLQYSHPNSNNSELIFNKPSKLNCSPNNPNPFLHPVPRIVNVTSLTQPLLNTNPPVLPSLRTVPFPNTSSNQNYGTNQSKDKNFQSPDNISLVSPDMSVSQSPSMPIKSTSSSSMCMAGNCTNNANQSCEKCSNANYCSSKCRDYDWYFHKNECQTLTED